MNEIVRRGSSLALGNTNGIAGERGPRITASATTSLINKQGDRFPVSNQSLIAVPAQSGVYRAVDVGDRDLEQVVIDPALSAIDVGLRSQETVTEWLSALRPKIIGETTTEDTSFKEQNNADIAFQILLLAAILLFGETLLARLSSRARISNTSASLLASSQP